MLRLAAAPRGVTPGSHPWSRRARHPVNPLYLLLLFAFPTELSALEEWISFENAYEISDVVCVADAVEHLPPEEPTSEVPRTTNSYRLRVVHVWKGEPPDTLHLRGGQSEELSAAGRVLSLATVCGGPRAFEVGRRYVVFASDNPHHALPAAHTHTRELRSAAADLIMLQRTKGSGWRVARDAEGIPGVSYRSLVHDLESGDSLAQAFAIAAFRELPDSGEVVLPALVRVLEGAHSPLTRRQVCNVLGIWSEENGRAHRALKSALEHTTPQIRLAAVEANCYGSQKELNERILDRLTDPVAAIRAAALRRCAPLLRRDDPPISAYVAALEDTCAFVRQAAVRGLQYSTIEPRVNAGLEGCLADPDPEVAAAARRVLDRMRSRGY